jgi:threonine dehydratase
METHAFGFRLQANAPGPKAISYQLPCAVVVIETAPKSKLERMRGLGAKLFPVPYEVA